MCRGTKGPLVRYCKRNLMLHYLFLEALAKLLKATFSFVMSLRLSVHPSVLMEQFGSHGKDFHKILYLSSFRKSVRKIQDSLKSNKKKDYFTLRPLDIFYHISATSP